MMIWHYTVKQRLDLILSDRLIRPAIRYVDLEKEKPVVWFSSNQIWEETANKMWRDSSGLHPLNKEQTHNLAGGLARIGVSPETAPHTWSDFKRLSGVESEKAQELYQAAITLGGTPSEWFVSLEPVSAEKWLAVELYDGANWIPLD
jgi:hypothetical protein